MGWYRSQQWREAIERFDAWFYESTQYVNDGGDRQIRDFHNLTTAAIDAVIDVARLDPMPVWDIYRFISDREQYRKHKERGYPVDGYTLVSVQEICDRLSQVQMYLDRMCRVGITSEKSGPDAIEVTSSNDDRDEWMYQQKTDGRTHGQIAADLARLHPEWERVDNEQSVGKAIDRFCTRHGKPLVRRKRGK